MSANVALLHFVLKGGQEVVVRASAPASGTLLAQLKKRNHTMSLKRLEDGEGRAE